MINLKQANYKSLKICGKLSHMSEGGDSGLRGPIFLGLARIIEKKGGLGEKQIGIFNTKHSVDMKFRWLDNR